MSVIYEKWFIRQDRWFEKGSFPGVGDKGQMEDFPYQIVGGFSLVGFHSATREKLHEYSGFTSLEEVEQFAMEHLIDMETSVQTS
jgi:hypothetical protein